MTDARFTEELRDACADDWGAVVNHRFVDELLAGTVEDRVMRRYLVQDYRFVDRFVALLGAAIASADAFAARVRLCRFAAMVTSEENTYFLRAFDALDVPEAERETPAEAAATREFKDLMAEAAETRSYPLCLAVLVVAEWSYLSWAERAGGRLPGNFVHAEWITLHDNADFRDFVGWLRAELDRTGAALDADGRERCLNVFRRATRLERRFFDAAYDDAA